MFSENYCPPWLHSTSSILLLIPKKKGGKERGGDRERETERRKEKGRGTRNIPQVKCLVLA